jgi:hypothetical protein
LSSPSSSSSSSSPSSPSSSSSSSSRLLALARDALAPSPSAPSPSARVAALEAALEVARDRERALWALTETIERDAARVASLVTRQARVPHGLSNTFLSRRGARFSPSVASLGFNPRPRRLTTPAD